MRQKVLDEEVVAAKSIKNTAAVRLAKTVLKSQKIEIIQTDKRTNTDGLLLIHKDVYAMCTQDKNLNARVRARNLLILTARRGKYLAIE